MSTTVLSRVNNTFGNKVNKNNPIRGPPEIIDILDIHDIDWTKLNFRTFELSVEEIYLILDNFIDLLNDKQIKYLNRQKLLLESSEEPEKLTSNQRYYITHKEQIQNRAKTWKQENKEDYNRYMREYRRKKTDMKRIICDETKTNRGRPRLLD